MRQLAEVKKLVEPWQKLEKMVADIAELISLSEEDASLSAEIQAEIEEASRRLDKLELERTLGGEYDARSWNWRELSAVSMMPEMLFWQSMPELEAQNPRIGHRCC